MPPRARLIATTRIHAPSTSMSSPCSTRSHRGRGLVDGVARRVGTPGDEADRRDQTRIVEDVEVVEGTVGHTGLPTPE